MSRWESRPHFDGTRVAVFSVPGLVCGREQDAEGRWVCVYTMIEEARMTELHEAGTQWQHYFHPKADDPTRCERCDVPDLTVMEKIRDTGWPVIESCAPTLPTGAADRKATPICTGVLDYFPDALAEVARVSLAGNRQHNLGPLRWEKSLSTDEADALVRHLLERGKRDVDGMRHSAKAAWRALALLQRELEAERA